MSIPFLIPFSIGHIFWTSWCPLSFVNNVQINPNPIHTAGSNTGDYNPIVTYGACQMGEIWKPDNAACFGCYCINGYVSRCFLSLNCPISTTASTTVPTNAPPIPTEMVTEAGTTTTQEKEGDTIITTTVAVITSTTSVRTPTMTIKWTTSAATSSPTNLTTRETSVPNALDTTRTTIGNVVHENTPVKALDNLPERRLDDLVILTLFNNTESEYV